MFSKFNAGLRWLGYGLLLTFIVSIAHSLWTGSINCRSCSAPMHVVEDMKFHSLTIRVYECTHCGACQVEQLRSDGTTWKPGNPATPPPAASGNDSTAEAAAPVIPNRA